MHGTRGDQEDSKSYAVRAQKFIIGVFGAVLMVVQVTFVIILLDRFLYVENAELAMAVTRSGISGGAGGSFGCFSLNSTVLLHTGNAEPVPWKEVSLSGLRMGDRVATTDERGEVSPAEVFYIRDYPSGPLVRIYLASGGFVEMTPEHLVFAVAGAKREVNLVPAKDVVPGQDLVLLMPHSSAQSTQPQQVESIEDGFWGPSRLVYTDRGSLLVSGIACSSWEHPSDAYTSWDAYAFHRLGWHWLLESFLYGAYFDFESAFVDPWMHRLWPTGRQAQEI